MFKRTSASMVSIVVLSAGLAACGGSDSNNEVGPVVTDPDAGNSGDGDATAFFNDQAPLTFANKVGGPFTRILGGFLGSAVGTDLDSMATRMATRASTSQELGCESGSGSSSFSTDDTTGELTSISMTFASCVNGDSSSNGSIVATTSGDFDGENGVLSVTLNDFSTTDPSGTTAVDGALTMSSTTVGDSSTVALSGTSLAMTAEGETVTFNDFSIDATDDDTTGASSVSASAEIVSSVDGTISVTIDPPFVTSGFDDAPASGMMAMTHSDGSSLSIDADTGNPATFNYVVNENGSVSSGTANWTDTELDLAEL